MYIIIEKSWTRSKLEKSLDYMGVVIYGILYHNNKYIKIEASCIKTKGVINNVLFTFIIR